jgi:hypothetical protein
MGWLFLHECDTKASVRDHLLRDLGRSNENAERKVLAHRTVGNHLWMAYECIPTDPAHKPIKVVVLALLAQDQGRWGYKDMDETMGPYYFDCPKAVIEAVGPTDNEHALKWRAKVDEYHAQRAAKRTMLRAVAVGAEIVLTKGCTPQRVKVTRLDGSKIYGSCTRTGGGPYKIPKKFIAEVIPAS